MNRPALAREKAPSAVGAAWLMLPIVVGVYLLLRFVVGGPTGIALAQAVYLGPPLLAASYLAAAAWATPAHTRERLIWSLMAFAAAMLAAGEATLSYAALLGDADPPAVFDLFNALATLAFVAVILVALRIDRADRGRAAQLSLDMLAVGVLGFSVVFTVRLAGVAQPSAQEVAEVVRLSVYGMIGAGVLAGDAVLTFGLFGTTPPWDRVMGAAIAFLAAGVMVWTVALEDPGAGAVGTLQVVAEVLYLLSYYLMFIAAYKRVSGRTDARSFSRPVVSPSQALIPAFLGASAGLISVLWLAWIVFEVPQESPALPVYLGALSVAVACMVGRVALGHAELSALSERAETDSVSGVLSARALSAQVSQSFARARRTGRPCVVVFVAVSGLASPDSNAFGPTDEVHLAAIGRALLTVCGSTRHVFRLTGGEFVVVGPVTGREGAADLARQLSIEAAGTVPGEYATSVGYAVYPFDGDTPEDLLSEADQARAWARRHGHNRVSGYDPRLRDTLAFDGRDRLNVQGKGRDMARALLAAADARDPANHYHARNVAALSRLLAEESGLDPEHVDRVEVAAILHDVGKIALPGGMLGGRTLSAREQRTAREHSELGERLVRSLSLDGVAEWIRAHHERWYGAGYPDGLAGAAIPLEARIIALADAYDGMTTGKRYGAPMSKAAALQEIDLSLGARFDPDLAELFIEVVGTTDALGWSDDWPLS